MSALARQSRPTEETVEPENQGNQGKAGTYSQRQGKTSGIGADIAAMLQHHSTPERRDEYRNQQSSGMRLTRMERLCLGHTIDRGGDRPFSRAGMRMSEVNRLIDFRYGGKIPANDDPKDGIIFAMTCTVNAQVDSTTSCHAFLVSWLARVAEWIEEPGVLVDGLLRKMHPARKHLTDRGIGRLVNLKAAERSALNIKTISPADMTPLQFSKARKEAKRQADRERDETRRRSKGSKPRAASATRTKPWLEAGFKCRRTWERQRSKNVSVANSSHGCADAGVANSSPLILIRIGREELATAIASDVSGKLTNHEKVAAGGGGVSPPTGPKASPSYHEIKRGEVPFREADGSLELPSSPNREIIKRRSAK